jgi:hypothetical protein
MRDIGRLSDHARAEIDVLLADGIQPSAEEIVRLNALAWEVESPQCRMDLSRGVPVECGGAWLWPLTIAAHDWFERVGSKFWRYSVKRLALAYAMAHGRSENGELDATGRAAATAVKAWGRRLTCREAELDEAMMQVLAQDRIDDGGEERDPDEGSVSCGDLVAALTSMTGLPADHWERRVSFSHALRVLHHCVQAQVKAGGGRTEDGAYIAAVRAEAIYIEELRKRHGRQED